jgi:maltose O-acetyltransferase
MKSEREKMLAGELYDPHDGELVESRLRTRELCREYNASAPAGAEPRRRLLAALFGTSTDAWIEPPFHCDYGHNITLGRKVYFNFNCVVLDVMAVRIGSHTLFGPAVQIYTAMHPIDADERRRGLEFAKPVTIGDDVWVGGAVVICPGVTIGDRAVIGAGSVVTRDVPADSFAAGNPCRVIRNLSLPT